MASENPTNRRYKGLSGKPVLMPPRGDGLWLYGWTHYGTSGQTPARLYRPTREVEIKDGDQWIRCAAGTDAFFTRDYLSA